MFDYNAIGTHPCKFLESQENYICYCYKITTYPLTLYYRKTSGEWQRSIDKGHETILNCLRLDTDKI